MGASGKSRLEAVVGKSEAAKNLQRNSSPEDVTTSFSHHCAVK